MPSRKTKIETLTRVRDNQRRCRARKREYVAELEHKLQECQVGGIRSNIEPYRRAVERIKDENRRLRDLLGQVGVSEASIAAHLGENCDARETSGTSDRLHEQTLSNLQESSSSLGLEIPQDTCSVPDVERTSPFPSFNDLLNIPFNDLPEDLQLFESTQSVSAAVLPSESLTASEIRVPGSCTPITCTPLFPDFSFNLTDWYQPPIPPIAPIPGDLGGCETAQKECGTTLCTVAYEMIRQQNKKGVDMIEIGIRLWNGFIKGDHEGEGCKVDNKLLYSVLDYIRA